MFKVNKYLTLKLVGEKTYIYVNQNLFQQCKFLLLNIPISQLDSLNEIDSIDEAAEGLSYELEPTQGAKKKLISPEVEFWAHCSNLQAWYENNYDSRLLHRNLAFPLLKKLAYSGDLLAKQRFKEEIIIRYMMGKGDIKGFLYEEYFSYLTTEDIINGLMKPNEANLLIKIINNSSRRYDFVQYFDEDKVRKRFNLNKLYFSIKNSHLNEFELDLNNFDFLLPDLSEFSNLNRLNVYGSSKHEKNINFNLGNPFISDLRLNLGDNLIIPDSFEKFPNLRSLSIYGTKKSKFEKTPNSIGSLKKLRNIEIINIPMEEFPAKITELPNLESLRLISNGLTKLPHSIKKIKSIKHLDLYGNN